MNKGYIIYLFDYILIFYILGLCSERTVPLLTDEANTKDSSAVSVTFDDCAPTSDPVITNGMDTSAIVKVELPTVSNDNVETLTSPRLTPTKSVTEDAASVDSTSALHEDEMTEGALATAPLVMPRRRGRPPGSGRARRSRGRPPTRMNSRYHYHQETNAERRKAKLRDVICRCLKYFLNIQSCINLSFFFSITFLYI